MKTRPTLLAGVALISLAVLPLLPAAPAHAHASELDSSPAADAVVAEAPTEVVITFDSPLLTAGAAIVVRGAADTDITTGPPVVDGPTLSVPVDSAAPDGGYSVAYRVVSEDGHTVEGEFAYSVGAVAAGSDGESAAASADADGTESHTEPWVPIAIIAGVGLVVLAGVAGALLLRR